jgi:hypothetical protein
MSHQPIQAAEQSLLVSASSPVSHTIESIGEPQ